MKRVARPILWFLVLTLFVGGWAVRGARACSEALATGGSTVDDRPVLWKNRDLYSPADAWKSILVSHVATSGSWGAGDRFGDCFDYTGVSHVGAISPWNGEPYVFMGANVVGLGMVEANAHTLEDEVKTAHGYSVTSDPNGMSIGQLNNFILSRCETVDDVEQLLRDTNDGGGYNGSFARWTHALIMVCDRWGDAATFEIDSDTFVRDNVTQEYPLTGDGYYNQTHDDDKDQPNPAQGEYSGYDWRSNSTRVDWQRPDNNYPYFVDDYITTVNSETQEVENNTPGSDGINDWEYSASAVRRWPRIGTRLDDRPDRDYRYFIQKDVPSGGIPDDYDVETLARYIGILPADTVNTSYYINRYMTVSSAVVNGCKIGDPYGGKLITVFACLGEPVVTPFIPIFPYAGEPPEVLDDMYLLTNAKRHQIYDYIIDDAMGVWEGRNVDHTIDLATLVGSTNNYYGEGGIQEYVFAIEDWMFREYDDFMEYLRGSSLTDVQLQAELQAWQETIAAQARQYYIDCTCPDITPPTVGSTSPRNGARNVAKNTTISVTFSEDVVAGEDDIIVTGSTSGTVSGETTYNSGTFTLTFTPSQQFAAKETVTVTVIATVEDTWDNGLDGDEDGISEGTPHDDYVFSFTTAK